MLMVEWDPVGNCRLLTWQNCWTLTMGRRVGGKSWGKNRQDDDRPNDL